MQHNCHCPCPSLINVLGPQGPQGPQGIVGPQGPQGPQGIPGIPFTNNYISLQSYNFNQQYTNTGNYEPITYEHSDPGTVNNVIQNGTTLSGDPAAGTVTLSAGHTYLVMSSLAGNSLQGSNFYYSYEVLINGSSTVPPGSTWGTPTLNLNISFIYTATIDTTIQVRIQPTFAGDSFLRGAFLSVVQLI